MTSIIVASNKKKAGKTSVVSAICAFLNSKDLKSSIYNPFNETNNLNIFEELGFDLVSNENFQSNDLSQKVINGISNEINLNSKDKILISESQINDSKINVDIAKKSNSKILYVANINEDIDSIIKYYGGYLGGIVFNKIPRHRYDEILKKYNKSPFFGFIPDNRYSVSNTIDQYAEHLGGEYIFENNKGNELILNVLIGGIVLDWSVHYYSSKEKVLALIRGDRPDLQLGAMQSGGNVKAIVLTKGIKPIEYVIYEAKKQEIPLISVKTNTHETAELISKIIKKTNFDHSLKLDNTLDLLLKNFDINNFKKSFEISTL